MVGVPSLGISKFSTWESRKKWHLGATFMANDKEYYKGGGGGFLQVRTVMSFVSSCMPVTHMCIKNASILH
jgi:hypothetical protein